MRTGHRIDPGDRILLRLALFANWAGRRKHVNRALYEAQECWVIFPEIRPGVLSARTRPVVEARSDFSGLLARFGMCCLALWMLLAFSLPASWAICVVVAVLGAGSATLWVSRGLESVVARFVLRRGQLTAQHRRLLVWTRAIWLRTVVWAAAGVTLGVLFRP